MRFIQKDQTFEILALYIIWAYGDRRPMAVNLPPDFNHGDNSTLMYNAKISDGLTFS